MAVLGILLLIVVVLAVLAALFRGGASVDVDLEWFSVKTDASAVFFAGVATTLLFFVSIWLVLNGAKRMRRRRAEMRALRQRADESEKARREQGREPTSTTTEAGGPGAAAGGPDEHFDSTPRDP
jgi:hypothetical protein